MRLRRRSQHVPDERPQPFEVPWREVGHEDGDDYPEGIDYIAGMGTATRTDWWGDEQAEQEWDRDIRRSL